MAATPGGAARPRQKAERRVGKLLQSSSRGSRVGRRRGFALDYFGAGAVLESAGGVEGVAELEP
jgi:hypothetical protein